MNLYQNAPTVQPSSEPQHIVSAREMASHIVANFTAIEQNEIFKVLQSILWSERVNQIDATASKLDFLKQSLEDLKIG